MTKWKGVDGPIIDHKRIKNLTCLPVFDRLYGENYSYIERLPFFFSGR